MAALGNHLVPSPSCHPAQRQVNVGRQRLLLQPLQPPVLPGKCSTISLAATHRERSCHLCEAGSSSSLLGRRSREDWPNPQRCTTARESVEEEGEMAMGCRPQAQAACQPTHTSTWALSGSREGRDGVQRTPRERGYGMPSLTRTLALWAVP